MPVNIIFLCVFLFINVLFTGCSRPRSSVSSQEYLPVRQSVNGLKTEQWTLDDYDPTYSAKLNNGMLVFTNFIANALVNVLNDRENEKYAEEKIIFSTHFSFLQILFEERQDISKCF